ncbi:MAG: histidine phosphatase family protein [Pseudomonadota bacterium]
MLRLFVMRHAKSSWAVPGARDFDRELNDRGRSDLALISAEIKRHQYFPEKILCSPSTRTRQTLAGISDAIPPTVKVEFVDALYSGGLDDYMKAIQNEGMPRSLMTIGHNPMSGSLASSLAGDGDLAAMEKIAFKYPTATIAILDFDIEHWSQLQRGAGNLIGCIFPSSLK